MLRIYNIAYFLYFPYTLCAHFTKEYIVGGIKTASYCLYNTHCGVIAFRCHKYIVLCAEQLFKGTGRGPEKKAHVIESLEEMGITVDATTDAMIEAAVYGLDKNAAVIDE